MKKRIALMALACAAICAALALAGCSQESPSSALDAKLKAIQGKDMAQIQALITVDDVLENGISLNDLFATDEQRSSGATGLTSTQQEALSPAVEKLLDFDYKITGETTQENVAYVTVEFTTYDNAGALANATASVIATSISQVLSGATSEQIMDANCQAVGDAFAALTEKDQTFTTAIPMYKTEEGKWEIADLSLENFNAIFGGIGSALEDVIESGDSGEEASDGASTNGIVKKDGKSVEK